MKSSRVSVPLLRRLASSGWHHPGFAPYWPLLRRLRDMALERAGERAAALSLAPETAGRDAAPEEDDPSTWDAEHWLPFMNRLAVWRGLRSVRGMPLRFVSGSDVGAVDYEFSILESGQVPCKPLGLGARHDFHNALVWLRFPRLKAAINWLHCQQAESEALQAGNEPERETVSSAHVASGASTSQKARRGRGPLRDALTLLDENGALWPAPAPEWVRMLEAREWHTLFVESRQALIGGVSELPTLHDDGHASGVLNLASEAARQAPVIVGHGLLEKLHHPYKSMTAKLLPCRDPRYGLDRGTAARLCELAGQQALRPALLLPLPLQGWPGWDPANADPAFYADERIFRPLRPAALEG